MQIYPPTKITKIVDAATPVKGGTSVGTMKIIYQEMIYIISCMVNFELCCYVMFVLGYEKNIWFINNFEY